VEDDRRILQLLEEASNASALGYAQEADRFLRQAQAEAPRHPLVLNEIARRMLEAGNPAGARLLLEQAVKDAPDHAPLWINLAAALRGLNLGEKEMAAVEKALALEPRNMRALLQKASLQESLGQERAAAATYRTALQLIPPGLDVPPGLRQALEHGQRCVDANNRAVEDFVEARLKNLRRQYAGTPVRRVDRCLGVLLQKERIYRQQPSFLNFPELPSIEFYDRKDFPWLDAIEAAADDIRAELVNVLSDGQTSLEPYIDIPEGLPLDQWKDLNRSRRWGIYYLWREGMPHAEHLARCPKTAKALEAWPRWDVPGFGPSAVFSILDAKTRIPPHCGVYNTRLLVHLPLIVPPACLFRVGGERREWVPGKAWVFDDTIEHEASNDSDVPRAVMILDIWSPFLSEVERQFVREVIAAMGDYYGTSSHARGAQQVL